jgi:hypothetical protein
VSTFPNSPKLLKSGIVLVDPATVQVQRLVARCSTTRTRSVGRCRCEAMGRSVTRSEALKTCDQSDAMGYWD